MGRPGGKRVLIIVQNLPVPLDRRVWLECQALRSQGYSVAVICPRGPDDAPFQQLEGVAIYRYKPAPEAKGIAGFLFEFAYSWIRTALLSLRVRRHLGFDVIQACNPPDTYWLLAWLWRSRGVRFVFDHHDLNPELFISRFGTPRTVGARVQYHGLLWLERMTFRLAHRVISTNGSYKHIAVTRGRRDPRTVTIVRSGPDTKAMRPIYPPAEIRSGADHLVVYLGIMGPQDGVEQALLVMDELVHQRDRDDVRAVLMGFGDCLADLRKLCTELGLDGQVSFTGRVGPKTIAQYLSAADLGLCPDLKTPLNELSTMNKTMEYMAYALPSVAFDLVETRVSAGETAVYVPSGDIGAFADAVEELLDDPGRRVALGRAARQRVSSELDWQTQAQAYVGVFDDLLGIEPDDQRRARWPFTARPASDYIVEGARYVDLDDVAEFESFIADRSPSSGSHA